MDGSPAPHHGFLSRWASRLKRRDRKQQKYYGTSPHASVSTASASNIITSLSTITDSNLTQNNTGPSSLAAPASNESLSTRDKIETAISSPSSERSSATKVDSPTSLSPWEEAYSQVSQETKAWLEENGAFATRTDEHIVELVELVRCSEEKIQEKAARLEIGDHVILWRDYAERVVSSATAIGDIAINFAPAPSSIAWSAVKVLLQTNVSERKDLVAIMGCSEVVLRLYRRGKVYEKVFIAESPPSDLNEELIRKLINVYKSCLEFLAFVSIEAKKRNCARFLDALLEPGHGEQRVSAMKALEQELDSTARAREAELNHENRKLVQSLEAPLKRLNNNVVKVLQELDEMNRKEAMDYISTIQVGTHHMMKCEKRTKGTCEWLISHSKFLEWENSANSSVFWLQGNIGTGKSFLSSKVIDRHRTSHKVQSAAEHHDDEGFAFFYCDSSDQARNTTANILRSYVRQLSELPGRCESIHKAAYQLYKTKSEIQSAISLEACIATLMDIINSYPRSTLVLDGLDECDKDTRAQLLTFLKRAVLEADRPLKVFIASRPESDISRYRESFQTPHMLVNIDVSDNESDIEKFVDDEMEKHFMDWEKIPHETRELVRTTLTRNSDGIWTYLQWEQLKHLEFRKDIEKRLDKLPKTLQAAYDEILKGYENDLSDLKLLQRAVRWVMYARRPLKSNILLTALRAESEMIDGDDCFERSEITDRKVESVCRHLVVKDPLDKVWRFPHASVREYFIGKNEAWLDNAQTDLTAFMINHLTDCCSTSPSKWPPQHVIDGHPLLKAGWLYGNASDPENSLDPQHPFQIYIQENWSYHVRDLSSQEANSAGVQQALKRFLGETGTQRSSKEYRVFATYMADCRAGLPRKLGRHMRPIDNNVFGIVALGLHEVISGWWDSSFDMATLENDRRTDLLSIAAACGQYETCEYLIAEGCDIDRPSQNGAMSPLYASIIEGQVDITRMLLQKGGNPNQIINDCSYLCSATNQISSEFVQLLLQNGADPNILCNRNDSPEVYSCNYGCPLARAAHMGKIDVVQALIKHKAAVNPRDPGGHYGSPLAAAVGGGRLKCAQFLVEHGAVINADLASGDYGSPLAAAVHWDRLECARFLVEHGAKLHVNPDSGIYGNLLAAAVAGGALDCARFLVEQGVEVKANLVSGIYGSPLAAAVYGGYLECAQFLVHHGAQVNTDLETGEFGSPLIAAIAGGELECADFLIQHGAEVNAQVEVGDYRSPWLAALCSKDMESVRFLAKHNADVNAELRFLDVGSPLGIAAMTNDRRLCSLLVRKGADPNASLRFGLYGSALAVAVANGNLRSARFLVDSGAVVNASLEFGQYSSALAAAVLGTHQSLDMIRFLVEESKADLTMLAKKQSIREEREVCECVVEQRREASTSSQQIAHQGCRIAAYLVQEHQVDSQILINMGLSQEEMPWVESQAASSSAGSSSLAPEGVL